tara:strand:+ start:24 stop:254 length:231 start_codon:yes stop_codon:yes gene_type:complete
MEAKEKANELANKFITKSVFDMTEEELKQQRAQGKTLATICVDEILKSIKRDSDFTTTYDKSKNYWNKVQKEINLL